MGDTIGRILIIEFINKEDLFEKMIEWLSKNLCVTPVVFEKYSSDLIINPFTRIVTDKKGKNIYLTAKEFDLLYFLVSHKEQVFLKEQLYNNVWGYDYSADANNLTSFIRKLRKKIEPDPDNPRYIITIRGAGYKFTEKEKP